MAKPSYDELMQMVHSLEAEVSRLRREKHDDGVIEALKGERNAHRANYQRLFQDAAMGILLYDGQFRILDANRQALKLLGYTHDEIVTKSAHDLIHPDDLNAQPLISVVDMSKPEQVMSLERHYLCKNGHHMAAEVKLCGFTEGTLLVMFQDISQRQRAEEALRAANEALEVIYRSAKAAIVGLDRQKRVTFWNPAAEKMFGWDQEEVLGKIYPAAPPKETEYFDMIFAEVMAGRTYDYLEVRNQHKDGTFFYAGSTTGPLRNENKEVIGLISIMFDVTQRKQAEEALQQSEQRYRSLVENTQEGYFICELPEGRFRFLNERLCVLLGYSQEEGRARTIWDIITADDHGLLRAAIDRQRKGHKIGPGANTFKARRKDGSLFRAEISSALVSFEETSALQGLLRDITEKERLQAQLQQAQRLESIGTLAGGVAHDFNNLLMAILGNTTLARIGLGADHPLYPKLNNIITYVQDASALTKQLLEFARGGKYEVKPTNLNILVEKTVHMFGRTKKELTIHTHLQPDLWVVEVDQGQIEQVLLNLLVNAWQAMPSGGRIDIDTANMVLDSSYSKSYVIVSGNYVCVSVTDSGLGMDKVTQEKIFEPFFTTKDRGRGTGLGLASAYGIIKNHDGLITVHSEKGKGSTFTFHLPAVEKEVAHIVEPGQPKALPGTESVLLVDDEEMILEVGSAMLKELGYRPLIARSGRDALEIYQREKDKIDLVILDMIMPVMSGGQTYDELRLLNPCVKTLLSSGYSLSGEASRILSRGCNGFIQKPFNMEDFSRKIREVLDSKGAPRAALNCVPEEKGRNE